MSMSKKEKLEMIPMEIGGKAQVGTCKPWCRNVLRVLPYLVIGAVGIAVMINSNRSEEASPFLSHKGHAVIKNHTAGPTSPFLSNKGYAVIKNPTAGPTSVLPFCYSTKNSRINPLSGQWVKDDTALPMYSNLSCAAEWSKYSCFHHGATNHAKAASSLKFRPTGCRLPTLHETRDVAKDAALQGRTVAFLGDSLLRQVMISWICMLNKLGRISDEDMHIEWPKCSKKKVWPCHSTLNCITCGPHSGSDTISVLVSSGKNSSFRMVYPANLEKLTERDILVTEAGVHSKTIENALKELEAKLQLGFENVPSNKRPTIIRMVTFTPHFKTRTGDYDTEELEALKNNKAAQGDFSSPGCRAESKDRNKQVEFSSLPPYDRSVLWLDGTNSLGKAKVGGSVGAYGDCQHFCMPGPTDEIARALEWLTIQTIAS
eukprot:CAMPEP_0194267530 /NCGR_PEP_ID=MMETSP0169-20130528/2015_1 /TAXON_ID=218684 /ORGANISM="Corethron pennatum, Strain L29A3" /LENGTH=429 /DNA_ID=CAMNT_0039008399 /DNA_START=72 /DNA_END=1361 /DNA_ORIENTATION=-